MKTRFSLTFVGIMVLAVAAAAQPRMMSPEDQAKQLKEQLKLSDTQLVDVTKILKEQREKMTALREKSDMGPDMREGIMKLAAETEKKMEKVLTEEQMVGYKKLMEERRQMRGRRRSG